MNNDDDEYIDICSVCKIELPDGVSAFRKPDACLCMKCYKGSDMEKMHIRFEEKRQRDKQNRKRRRYW